MHPAVIATTRLHCQQISNPTLDSAAAVVRWMGAMQAQDYHQALWALGVRLPGSTVQQVEQAIADGKIIRTWPMRGTIHFVPPQDAGWMLRLMAARILARDGRRMRELGLDVPTLIRCDGVFIRMLQGGKRLKRSVLLQGLQHAGIPTDGQRGYHILWHSAQTGLLAITAMEDKEQTFALLDECAPHPNQLTPQEALVEITRRYFQSHSPATAQDFARWTGLTLTEARNGIAQLDHELIADKVDTVTYWRSAAAGTMAPSEGLYLLPGFDEYLLGYQDRSAVLAPQYANHVCPGKNGVFFPLIVEDGQVIGTWKRLFKPHEITTTCDFFAAADVRHRPALQAAFERFSAFWGLPVQLI